MQLIVSDLNLDSYLYYFDDIIIPSKGIEDLCERMETASKRLRQHNLKVEAFKYCFGAPKFFALISEIV